MFSYCLSLTVLNYFKNIKTELWFENICLIYCVLCIEQKRFWFVFNTKPLIYYVHQSWSSHQNVKKFSEHAISIIK